MNKYLITAAVLAISSCFLSACNDAEHRKMVKAYNIDETCVFSGHSLGVTVAGELKLIRELLQKQVALEMARQRASRHPNPLCESAE